MIPKPPGMLSEFLIDTLTYDSQAYGNVKWIPDLQDLDFNSSRSPPWHVYADRILNRQKAPIEKDVKYN